MSSSQQLIKKMANMSLSDGRKTRHESKLLYRKDHMSPNAVEQLSLAVEQISLPDTFSPLPFDHSWKKKLPAVRDVNMGVELGGEYSTTKVKFKIHVLLIMYDLCADRNIQSGLKNDSIKATPSKTKASVRSDLNESKNDNFFNCDNSRPALAHESVPKECFECGQKCREESNAPDACVFHWGKFTLQATPSHSS
ncbi:hypothetical protein PG993_000630 [Apiospora rasikravindrae]|uniref:Uncharacterized protein n=1 Tax=Apiospora rasikravindrae TaxID=990691 RepID=A0ABR1U937_9PEZI